MGSADGDVEFEIAGVGEVAGAAAVIAAGCGFEFGDDLLGADLGGAGDGAAGESGAEEGVEGGVGAECAADGAGGLKDAVALHAVGGVAVMFDGAGVIDVDGADVADAAEIVAHEIDDHGEFGLIFE